MPTNYLPRLKDGVANELMPPHEIGVWDHDPAKARLHALAKAIDVQPGATQIHSIPDPWARVILFGRALFDPKHALHQRVLGEWRGLLAILGLKEIRRFSELTVAPVVLDREDAAPAGFLATIARMKPSTAESFAADGSWDNFHIFRWCGKKCGGEHRPFGMTSLATLVATGTYYKDVFSPEEVPWFVDGYLVDPVTPLDGEDDAPGNLSKSERLGLAEWVLFVRSRLQNAGDSVRHGEVLDYLDAYASDLSDQARVPKSNDVISDVGLGIQEPDYFECLDKPRRPAAHVLTDLQIVPDRSVDKTYILYDPDLSRQLKRKDRDVTVFGTVTLASAKRDLSGIGTKKSGQLASTKDGETHWCTPAFFFQDDLIYEQLSADSASEGADTMTFPGCRAVNMTGRSENRHIALPLTEDAAKLFTPEYLAENFWIDWLASGGARCRLKLKVRSVRNKSAGSRATVADEEFGPPADVEIVRIYEEKDLNKIRQLPLVCVWPNFRFPDEPNSEALLKESDNGFRNRWKRYFIFESWMGSKAEELLVLPLDQTGMSKQLYTKSSVFQVVSTPRFPEVLVCEMPFSGKKPPPNDNRRPKGLLLLQKPESPTANEGLRTALGVDFGTTGTSIYRARVVGGGTDTEEPTPISFPDRVLQITGRSETDLKDLTRHFFIPAKIKELGRVLSVYQTHDSGGGHAEVIDGHVLFQDPGTKNAPFVWGSEGMVLTNLKWGDEKLQADAAEAFLSQLCIQSLAELVAGGTSSIDVRYSYPTAFDDADLRRFRGIWDGVLGEIQTVTSVPITPNKGNAANYEAVAAARFFAAAADMHFAEGALILDIGGGTTDLAVWNAGARQPQLIAHSSVLFAGTDMFQAVLRGKLELLKKIDENFPLPAMDKGQYKSAYFAEIDALISKHGDRLLQRLPRACVESDEVREFTSILEIGMSGIGFYSGLVLGHLMQAARYDAAPSFIRVFIGGNASRLLHWCDLGEFQEGTPFYKKLCGCILDGARVGAPELIKGKSVEISISDKPKEEVAFGLVASYLDTERSTDHANPLAGENFRVGDGEMQSWSTAPGLQDLLTGELRVERDLPVFSLFLQAMNEEVSDSEKEKIIGSINDSLTRMKQKTEKQQKSDAKLAKEMKSSDKLNPVRKEPLFIVALKGLIDMRIKKLVKGA